MGRLLPLILGLTLAVPSRAGETAVLVGPCFGPLRQPPRRAFGSLEVDHRLDDSCFGLWGTFDFTTDGDHFVGAGPSVTWSPGGRWLLAGSSGPGYYLRQSGFDLGCTLEFRSTFYVAHRIGRGGWAGVSYSHYSNGGLRKHNPGAETMRLFWAIPFARR